MIRGINHVAINTRSIDRLSSFYEKVLGDGLAMQEICWKNNPKIDSVLGIYGSVGRQRMLRGRSCYLELFEFTFPEGKDGALHAYDRGITHFALEVDDINAEFERLSAIGMTFLSETPVHIDDKFKVIYGQDPDGNLVELIEVASEHPYALAQLNDAAEKPDREAAHRVRLHAEGSQ